MTFLCGKSKTLYTSITQTKTIEAIMLHVTCLINSDIREFFV